MLSSLDRAALERHVLNVCPPLLGETSIAVFERSIAHPSAHSALRAFASGDSAFLIVSRVQVQTSDSEYDYAESLGSVSIDEDDFTLPPDRHSAHWVVRFSTDLRYPQSGSRVVILGRAESGSGDLVEAVEVLTIGHSLEDDHSAETDRGTAAREPFDSVKMVMDGVLPPLIDSYVEELGSSKAERDQLKRKVKEATMALKDFARGQCARVAPVSLKSHREIVKRRATGVEMTADGLEEEYGDKKRFINELQSCVVRWTREINRVVEASRRGPEQPLSAIQERLFWTSADVALQSGVSALADQDVKLTLDLLGRKRRATGFLSDARTALESSRRKISGYLTLLGDLPLDGIEKVDDVCSLSDAVRHVLEHINSKLRISGFPLERALTLVNSLSVNVTSILMSLLVKHGGVLRRPYKSFQRVFEDCTSLFATWYEGYDSFRRVCREIAKARKETLAPRQPPAFAALERRLRSVADFRNDHVSLTNVVRCLASKLYAKASDDLADAIDSMTETLSNTSALDLSPIGERNWTSSLSAYSSCITHVEEALTGTLVRLVTCEEDIHRMSASAAAFKPILKRPSMSTALTEILPFVVRVVENELEKLHELPRLVSPADFESTGEELRGISPVSGHVIILRQIKERILRLEREVRSLLGPLMSTHPHCLSMVKNMQEMTRKLGTREVSENQAKKMQKDSEWFPSSRLVFNVKRQGSLLYAVLEAFNPPVGITTEVKIVRRESQEIMVKMKNVAREMRVFIPPLISIASGLDAYTAALNKLKGADRRVVRRIRWLVQLPKREVEDEMIYGVSGELDTSNADLVARYASSFSRVTSRFFDCVITAIDCDKFVLDELNRLRTPNLQASAVLQYVQKICSALKEQNIQSSSYCDAVSQLLVCELTSLFKRSLHQWTPRVSAALFVHSDGTVELDPPLWKLGDLAFKSLASHVNDLSLVRPVVSEESEGDGRTGFQKTWLMKLVRNNLSILYEAYARVSQHIRSIEKSMDKWRFISAVLHTPHEAFKSEGKNKLFPWISLVQSLENIHLNESSWIEGALNEGAAVTNRSIQALQRKLRYWREFAKRGLQRALDREKEDIVSLAGETVTLLNDFKDLMDLASVLFEVDPLLSSCEHRAALCSEAEAILGVDDPSRSISNTLHSLNNVVRSKRQLVNNARPDLEAKHESRVLKAREEVNRYLVEVKSRKGNSNLSRELEEITHLFDSVREAHKNLVETSREGEILGLCGMNPELEDVNLMLKYLEMRMQPLKELNETSLLIRKCGSSPLKDSNLIEVKNCIERALSKALDMEQYPAVGKFVSDLRKRVAMIPLLSRLQFLRLSPPRELDISRRLFDQDQNVLKLKDRYLIDLWRCDVIRHKKFLDEVIENAAGEANIMKYFQELQDKWIERKPDYIFKNGAYLLKGFSLLLDESTETLQSLSSLSSSPYANLFENDQLHWEERISRLKSELEVWAELQTKWIHLRSLFAGEAFSEGSSIRFELRKEFAYFESVNNQFCKLTAEVRSEKGILEALNSLNHGRLLQMGSDLTLIVRSLRKFLESQRASFPRFFFLADNDLLDLLSCSAANIENIVPHVPKVFPGVRTLKYEKRENSLSILSAVSKEGEILVLKGSLVMKLNSSAVHLLKSLEESFRCTLQHLLPNAISYLSKTAYCLNGSGADLSYACKKFPSQILVLASKIAFSSAVESQFDRRAELWRKLCDLIAEISSKYALEKDRLNSLRLEQLTKELVHQRNVLDDIKHTRAAHISNLYAWQKNIRFYADRFEDELKSVVVRCVDSEMEYGWEYLGVSNCLVQTRLTQRCVLSLTQALKYGLGGSPFGPAGTGKTETVKFLGHSLGRLVVVFNCDESFDSASLGRILAGVCRLGAWVCFDEFNRLRTGILSEASDLLATVQHSIQQGTPIVKNFYGGVESISVRRGTGVFITMNPSYKGRRELPANLKSLFRPIAMAQPDMRDIAEVSLFAKGFSRATVLSKKLVSLLRKMSSSVVKNAYHDFGLRGLTSIILTAKCIRDDHGGDRSKATLKEEEVIEKAVWDTFGPKLATLDKAELKQSTNVLFRSANRPSSSLPPDLLQSVYNVAESHHLLVDDLLIRRLEQLYTLLKHHYGVLIVGPSGSGKSTTWEILYNAMKAKAHSLNAQNGNIACALREEKLTSSSSYSQIVLDPKTLSMSRLYGVLDPTTREWTDGILTRKLREIAVRNAQGVRGMHWIVFDGEIDPDWVENLNSVLDDTHCLTLASGERMALESNVRFLFEAEHLEAANLSTISRCGMMCFEKDQQLPCVITRYYSEVSCSSKLHSRCIGHVKSLQDFMVKYLRRSWNRYSAITTVTSSIGIVNCTFTMFSAHIKQYSEWHEDCGNDIVEKSSEIVFARNSFLMCFALALSARFSAESRRQLTLELLSEAKGSVWGKSKSFSGDFDLTKSKVSFETGEFVPLAKLVKPLKLDGLEPERIGAPDIVIPTVTTEALREVISRILLGGWSWAGETIGCASPTIPVLCGPPGSGKSMIINSILEELPNVSPASISFSSSTRPVDVITALKSVAEISKTASNRLQLRPRRRDTRIVLFCDEINLCSPDAYGNLSTISFLRSLILRKGFWSSRTTETWVGIPSLSVVAACNPPEDAGRHALPERFLRHCSVIYTPNPDDDDLYNIFSSFVSASLCATAPDSLAEQESLSKCVMSMYKQNRDRFAPEAVGPRRPHYIYSARDLCRLVKGLTQTLLQERKVTSATIIRTLMHEARRVFIDRLATASEKKIAEEMLRSAICTNSKQKVEKSWLQPVLFTSFLSRNRKKYCVIKDKEELRSVIYHKLRVFSQEEGLGGSLTSSDPSQTSDVLDQFVVTDSVLEHLTRMERILRLPLGHAVLIGPPGIGKKTFARFTAWMMNMRIHRVSAHRGYTAQELQAELQSLMTDVVLKGKKTVILFDESSCEHAGMLEMMNALLASGDIPGLFEGEERSKLVDGMRKRFDGCGTLSDDLVYRRFVDIVREDFHVVFTLTLAEADVTASNFVSSALLSRSPALYNRCVVDYIEDWDDSTLSAVADVKLEEVVLGQERDRIVSCAVKMHRAAPAVTPRDYLEFIEQVARISLEKFEEIASGGGRVAAGLNRLRDAEEAIGILKGKLESTRNRLKDKELQANSVLGRMADEQQRAEKAKVDATDYSAKAQDAAISAEQKQALAEERLKLVEPQVEQARLAVGGIRKEHLEELRAMPAPPAGVKVAVECVMQLLGEGDMTWGSMRTKMRGGDLIKRVLELDISKVKTDILESLTTKIEAGGAFDIDKIYFASKAAGPLAEWCLASLEYAAVMEETEPLRAEVEEIRKSREELLAKVAEAEQIVRDMTHVIEECKREYCQQISEAEKYRREMNEAKTKVDRAEKVLVSLNDEWEKWAADAEKYDDAATTLWGDSVLAAAFVAYCGKLDGAARKALCEIWKDILLRGGVKYADSWSFSGFLVTAKQKAVWTAMKLPIDEASIESYVILMRSARYPLIIDPGRNVHRTVSSVLAAENCKDSLDDYEALALLQSRTLKSIGRTSFSNAKGGKLPYLSALEGAMRFGNKIVLEDSEDFDYSLSGLVGQEAVNGSQEDGGAGSGQRSVRIRSKLIDQSPSFRLFLAASDLQGVPGMARSRSCVVSFATTEDTVRALCFSKALAHVLPELEKKRADLLSAQVLYTERKRVLQDRVLSVISNSSGTNENLLDGPLLATLETLKAEALITTERSNESMRQGADILRVRDSLGPVLDISVRVHLVLQNLAYVNPLYRVSLSKFLETFGEAVRLAASKTGLVSPFRGTCRNADTAHIWREMHRLVCSVVYRNIAPSLFPRDQLPFAAALCLAAKWSNGDTRQFIQNASEVLEYSCAIFEDRDASNEESLQRIKSDLPKGLVSGVDVSKIFSVVKEGDLGSLSELSVEEFLCLIPMTKMRRADILSSAITGLSALMPGFGEISSGSGAENAASALREHIVSFLSESRPVTKPLMLCSRGSGVDPSSLVQQIATEHAVELNELSLGSTAIAATSALSALKNFEADSKGAVFLLKNVHLARPTFIEGLRQLFLKENEFPFMLVITLEDSNSIGKVVGAKLGTLCNMFAFEKPFGFKSALHNAVGVVFSSGSKSDVYASKNETLHKENMLAALAWLHAHLLERSKRAPVGFSKMYDFTQSDLILAAHSVESLRERNVPVSAIADLICEAIYGGRIENELDDYVLKLVAHNLIDDVLNEKMVSAKKVCVVQNEDTAKLVNLPLPEDALRSHISHLPLSAPLHWFGLGSSAEATLRTKDGSYMLRVLHLMINGIGSHSVGSTVTFDPKESTEEVGNSTQLMRIKAFISILPSRDEIQAMSKSAESGIESKNPVERFWAIEKTLLIDIFGSIRSDLEDLEDVVEGKKKMNRREGDLIQTLFGEEARNVVVAPQQWKRYSLENRTMTVESLLKHYSSCFEFLQYVENQIVLNCQLILRPYAFISVLQFSVCKALEIPVENSEPVLIVGKGVESEDLEDQGTFPRIVGLELKGACWHDERQWLSCEENGDVMILPPSVLRWRTRATVSDNVLLQGKENEGNRIHVPIFVGSFDASRMFYVEMNTDPAIAPSKLRLQGVAIQFSR